MRLSQADLADYLGVARATLSQATSNGHKCKGYPVRAWAEYDGEGRVAGYDVPNRVLGGGAGSRSNPSDGDSDQASASGSLDLLDNLPSRQDSVDIDASQRTSVLPEGQDYFRPAASGGAAYALAQAVREDTGTARAISMIAGVGIGGLVGKEASGQHEGVGALIGALLGGGAAYLGIEAATPQTEAEPPTRRTQQKGSWQDASGMASGDRVPSVNLDAAQPSGG